MGGVVTEMRHVVHAYDAVAKCDVVHDHTLFGPLYAGSIAAPPVVTTNHGPFDANLGPIYTAVAKKVPVIAISRAQAAVAPHIPVAAVIHHGIDAEAFPFGDGAGGHTAFLGRMSPDKGAHRAIRVAREAGVPLLLAAKMREPAEHEYFETRVRPLLGGDIEYIGELGPADKKTLLAGAIALLNPIRWGEPFGLVMIESLACGTPVLAFPSGAAPEIIEHGRTGFLCGDEQEMANAVSKVLDLSRRDCRAAVEGYFSTARMAAEHAAFYAAVVDGDIAAAQRGVAAA
jgi:glycosyltransferase involved in cell wall biosynthesis